MPTGFRSSLTSLVLAALLSSLASRNSAAADPGAAGPGDAPRVDVRLREVRWQPLPDGVTMVYAGPDGRAWYQLEQRTPLSDPVLVRQVIEREFRQPAPQLPGLRTALFEPSGRIWFTTAFAAKPCLLGYDGHTWVEHALSDRVSGNCPGHAEPGILGSENVFVDGVAFFLTGDAVDSFDGKRWSRQTFPSTIALQPELDGKGVDVLVSRPWNNGSHQGGYGPGGGPPPPVVPALWRWRGGKWDEADRLLDLGQFSDFAPDRDGVWILGGEGVHDVSFQPYEPGSPAPADRLIAQLGNPDPVIRENAAGMLEVLGAAAATHLKEALASAKGPLAPAGLRKVLAQIEEDDRSESYRKQGRYPPTPPRPAVDEAAAQRLIDQLADSDPAVGDRAAAELRAMGPSVGRYLGTALNQAQIYRPKDRAFLGRLNKVSAEVSQDEQFEMLPAHPFGRYRLKRVSVLTRLPKGRICASAEHIFCKGIDLGPGFIIRDVREDTFRAVLGREAFEACSWPINAPDSVTRPLPSGGGRVWLPSSRYLTRLPLMDLKSGKVVDRVPDGRFDVLRAAFQDGRVFVGSLTIGPRIMAFTLGAPEATEVLVAHEMPGERWLADIATDGAVWAYDLEDGVLRFEGNRWERLGVLAGPFDGYGRPKSYGERDVWGIAGRDGQMLVKVGPQHALCAPPGTNSPPPLIGNLRQMIQQHRARFTDAFASNWAGDDGSDRHSAVVVDKAANVWLLDDDRSELSVLIGDQWEYARLALEDTGIMRGFVRHLYPLGDGGKVYLTNFDWLVGRGSQAGAAATGQVQNGKLLFTQAPATAQPDVTPAPVRDATGGLWVPFVTHGQKSNLNSSLVGESSARLTDVGASDPVEGEGWPVLGDHRGNIWFARASESGRIDQIAVWRDGKIACRLALSGGIASSTFFADDAGAVYAFTETGLTRFVAPDPAQPGQFRFDKTWRIDGITGAILHVEYSRLGYLVIIAEAKNWMGADRFYLVRV